MLLGRKEIPDRKTKTSPHDSDLPGIWMRSIRWVEALAGIRIIESNEITGIAKGGHDG
jgi:hypothetical protein